jgi:hypothetical protein
MNENESVALGGSSIGMGVGVVELVVVYVKERHVG